GIRDGHVTGVQTCALPISLRVPMNLSTRKVVPTPAHLVELERLGDEIAKLSAHLDAATARLLDLIREFDARGGWGNGFASCAARSEERRVGKECRAGCRLE